TKIARAIQDHTQHHLHQPQVQPLRTDLEDYLNWQLQTTGRLEIVIHFHSGAFASEMFDIRQTVHVDVSDNLHFDTLAEDTRYVCTRRSARRGRGSAPVG